MDCSPPGSSVPGILQARILEWVAVSFSRRASQCRDWTHDSMSPASAEGFFTSNAPCPSVSCRILNTRTWECQQKHPKKSLLNPSKLTGQLSLFSCSAVSDSLRPHALQHARLPVLQYLLELAQTHVCWVRDASQPSHSLSPPSPLAPQSSTASGSFLVSQLFASDGQSTGASAPVLSMNIQNWFPLGLTGLISLQSNGFSSLL